MNGCELKNDRWSNPYRLIDDFGYFGTKTSFQAQDVKTPSHKKPA